MPRQERELGPVVDEVPVREDVVRLAELVVHQVHDDLNLFVLVVVVLEPDLHLVRIQRRLVGLRLFLLPRRERFPRGPVGESRPRVDEPARREVILLLLLPYLARQLLHRLNLRVLLLQPRRHHLAELVRQRLHLGHTRLDVPPPRAAAPVAIRVVVPVDAPKKRDGDMKTRASSETVKYNLARGVPSAHWSAARWRTGRRKTGRGTGCDGAARRRTFAPCESSARGARYADPSSSLHSCRWAPHRFESASSSPLHLPRSPR